mmetsp:Transcript_11906/g.19385  ORF Transcript_11906/g.19385 Transcript_11906/m.19385 type:complete len:288 (+) Transcript_11906:1281-2144(+)
MKPSKRTSLFRGVSRCGKDGHFQARIRDGKKVKYLGRFSTEIQAAIVYDEHERALKGQSAKTNFVPLDDKTKEDLKTEFARNNENFPPDLLHLVSRANQHPLEITIKKDTPFTPIPDFNLAMVLQQMQQIQEAALGTAKHVQQFNNLEHIKSMQQLSDLPINFTTPSIPKTDKSPPARKRSYDETFKELMSLKTTSKFRGVSCCGRDRKWQARIRQGSKIIYLGRYSTQLDAALAYDEAARTLRGKDAAVNFVSMDPAQKEKIRQFYRDNKTFSREITNAYTKTAAT